MSILSKLLDPKVFIESCLFIVDKYSNKVPFIFNPLQELWWKEHSNSDIIIKARKMGFSSLIEAIWLHACIFKENTRAVIVSHEEGATKRLLEKVHYYIDTSLVPIKTKKNSEHEISFPETNSTLWIGTAGQRAFGRGDDVTHLHFSEFCHYENFNVLTGVREAMRTNGIVIFESTANGAGNESHKFWMNAVSGKNSYKPCFYGWYKNPEYDCSDNTPFELTEYEKGIKEMYNLSWSQLRWRRNKIRDMTDPSLFQQEYPISWEEAFLVSGQMVFDWKDVKKQENAIMPVKWICDIENIGGSISINPNPNGDLTIWRTPAKRI